MLAATMAVCGVALGAHAELRILRIGTGGTGGTYFPIGSLIAQGVSEPLAGHAVGTGGGVPGLLAVPEISNGSISNVEGMREGLLDAALVQSDVAYWAHHGLAIFEGGLRHEGLRAVANLYPESLHLVARLGSGIESVKDLRGHRVSLDEPGSGTLHDARLILKFHGVEESELETVYLKAHFAVEAMARNELDAFFVFVGYPAAAIMKLAASSGATLVPIEGPAVNELIRAHPYFSRGIIPAGTYGQGIIPAGTYAGVGDTPTLTVGAQLIVNADLEEELVYRLTGALWSSETRRALEAGHPKGREVQLGRALEGVSIPLHPGAEHFYREYGILPGKAAVN